MAALRDPWAQIKLRELDDAVALCAGLWLDAEADRWAATPGSPVRLRLTVMNRSRYPLELRTAQVEGGAAQAGGPLPYNQPLVREVTHQAPAHLSQPFWLEKPPQGAARSTQVGFSSL